MKASSDTDPRFAGRLKAQRLARGLSQAELAGGGVSPSYVSLLEAGRRTPTAEVVAHLAARLGCSPELLTHGVNGRGKEEVHLELAYAELALRSGEQAEAERRFRGLLSDPLVSAVAELRARTTRGLAEALEALGHLEQAIAAYEQLLPGEGEDPDDGWLPLVVALCRCYREAGDLAHSVELGERAAERARSLGLAGTDEEVELAATLVAAYHERGDVMRARVLAGQVVARAERSGTRRARGAAYWNASLVASSHGRTQEAVQLAERALGLYAEGGNARSLARLRSAYAWLLLRQPAPEALQALTQLDTAAAALLEDGSEVDLAYCDVEAARALLHLEDVDGARARVLAGLHRLGPQTRLERASGLVVLGRAELASGAPEAAVAALREAAVELAAVDASRESAVVWCELAELCEALDDHVGALDAYRHATGFLGVRSAVRLPAAHT
jgi:transcriptional regulator with XRE-family HTH domain